MLKEFRSRRNVKIGVAPLRRNPYNGPNFNLEEAILYKNMIYEELKNYDVEIVTLEDICDDGLLFSVEGAEKAAEKFIREKVDGVFIPHVNFGCEEAAARLGKMVGKPVLLWGPQDDIKEDGYRYRDSQCGLFATSKVFQMYQVPFSYIVNSDVTSDKFKDGFDKFVSVCCVVKAATNMRIGQISVRPGPFYSVKIDEIELLRKFGVEVIPIAMSDLKCKVDQFRKEHAEQVEMETKEMKERHKFDETVTEENIRTVVGIKRAIEQWALEEDLSAVATMCWKPMVDTFGISACFVLSEICDDGLPCICETDIHGAIGSVLTMAAERYDAPMFLADLTIRNPENENSELLWHCGVFAKSLAREGYEDLPVSHHHGRPAGCVGRWQLKRGDLSIVRFDGLHGKYSMFLGHAKAIDGPYTLGSYVWIQVDNWDKWEEKLIYGPYIHHCIGVYHDVVPVLQEACRYLPITPDLV